MRREKLENKMEENQETNKLGGKADTRVIKCSRGHLPTYSVMTQLFAPH